MSYSTCSRPQPFWGPSAGLSSVCQYPSCLVLVQSQTRHSSPDVVSQVTKRSLPQPAGYSFANTVQYALVLHCCKGTFGPPLTFSAKLLSIQSAPSPFYMSLSHFRWRTLCFPLLNFIRYPLAHLSSLLNGSHAL